MSECESLRQQVTVSEAGSRAMLEQYQTTVGEMEGLKTHYKVVEGQLGETTGHLQEVKTELEKREAELGDLQSHLVVTAREEYDKVQGELVEKEAAYLDLQQSSAKKIKSLEVHKHTHTHTHTSPILYAISIPSFTGVSSGYSE